MCGQRTIAWDAWSETTYATRRRQFLNDVGAIIEVILAGLNAAILTYGGVDAVRRLEGAVVAEPRVDRQPRSRFP